MKTMKKILIGTLCCVAITGFALYEAYSIVKKEYLHQTEIAAVAHEKINYNLDMIKIAVMTEDVETYEKNLAEITEQINIIAPLGLVKSEQTDYLNQLEEYTTLLNNKVELLTEMQSIKSNIATVKDKLNENYGDEDSISRDKLKESKDKVLEFKIKPDEYTEEKVLAIINQVNGALEGISEKASALAECIDTCYADRISEIDDELADKMKSFADAVDELNSNLEKEFSFDKMESIKENKTNG
ncbi:hypothetical protein IKT18_01995 [Candidatus Saccharibacteria bacterium]|nr:hypothetical protein [Candidatus Saccharibacteria bacterium]